MTFIPLNATYGETEGPDTLLELQKRTLFLALVEMTPSMGLLVTTVSMAVRE
jgi:hypothetical protein